MNLALGDLLPRRTAHGEVIDFLLEIGDRLLPIEVNSTSQP